jgi:hypothetical protein
MTTVLGLAAQGNAAEQSPQPQRPLLQPPVEVIPSPVSDRFAVRAMYFRSSISTTARYDNIAGAPGDTFNAEDTIGVPDTSNQGWIDLLFRMTPRHRIAAQFYQLKRSGTALLSQPLDFGDETFQPGDGEVRSHMELRQLNLRYAYSVVQREQLEVGLGLGLHLLQLEGTLEAPAAFKREQLDTAGPYPTLAADVSWRFTRRFSVNAATHFVSFKSGGVNGRSLAWSADLQFRAWRNLAVGVGYASTLYRLDSSDPDYFPGYLKLRYQGPELFLRASF